MHEPLSADQLRKLLLDHVGDLEELQVLVCFHAAGTDSSMTLEQLVAASHLPEASVQQALAGLAKRGVIESLAGQPGRHRFAPPNDQTRREIERLVAQYRTDPLTLIKIMAAASIERMRSAALYTFAEAFRVKRPKSDG